MNSTIFIGRLTGDPKLVEYNKEKFMTIFTLAVKNEREKDKADFFKVMVFGKAAENCSKYLNKGDLVCASGSMHNENPNEYTKDNIKYINKNASLLIANRVEFLEYKKRNPKPEENHVVEDDEVPSSLDGFTPLDDDDDEIPF